MSTWKGELKTPKVSICCITYNHVNFLSKALDSFLMQVTSFPFEILVHDDASNDGTTELLRTYQNKFPQIIKAVIQVENKFSKARTIASNYLFPISKGKYIALCEGDDFWTSRHKIQKQVDFLERNSKFSLYTHAVEVVNNTIKEKPFYPTVLWTKKENTFLDVLNNHFIPTPSLMFRNEISDYPFVMDGARILQAEDMAIELFMASKGLCYYDSEEMGVYRNHDDGITKAKNRNYENEIMHWTYLYSEINKYTKYKYNRHILIKLCGINITYMHIFFREREFLKCYELCKKSLLYGPVVFVSAVGKKITKKFKRK